MSRKPIREQAEAEGLIRYRGTICERHPDLNGERHTANATCIGCQADYQAQRRIAVPEANRRATAKWRDANRSRLNAMVAAWRLKNLPRKNAAENVRRARRIGATPRWLTEADHASMNGQYAMSALMTVLVGVKYSVDHIVPLQGRDVRGLHVPWNLRVIRASDNSRKGNRLISL